jgi:hypothetical protein
MIRRANRSGRNKGMAAAVVAERRYPMKLAPLAAVAAIAFLTSPAASFAQSSGGSAGGSSAGNSSGSAAGSPSAGAAGAGSQGVSGTPPGPAAPGGLNNASEDPSGQANAVRRAPPSAPGTNTAGTAQSSGSGVTTGSARSTGAGGATVTGPQTSGDVEVDKENKEVDRKIKSICRGC